MTQQKYQLVLAYDGTNFEGWQCRRSGRGVRQEIEQALMRLFGTCLEIESSSRTDAGVHAMGLVIHVVIPLSAPSMAPLRLRVALNSQLPEDLRVMRAKAVPAAFHARFDAMAKEYRYRIHQSDVMPPPLRHQHWHIPHALDLKAMKEAAAYFIGRHDFRNFTVKRRGELLDAHRTIIDCRIMKQGPAITIRIIGEGFLYKMCRRMVGTLVRIGEGKIPPSSVIEMLQCPGPRAGGFVAPAHGLSLWSVRYPHSKSEKGVSSRVAHFRARWRNA